MSRRFSTNDLNTPRPYQIYTELVDVGKTIGGTKKKIRWRFGWSDSETEYEIELKHSLVSGKKVCFGIYIKLSFYKI